MSIEHRADKENVVSNTLSRSPHECVDVVNLYSYLENPKAVQSANVHMFLKCFQSYKLLDSSSLSTRRVTSFDFL